MISYSIDQFIARVRDEDFFKENKDDNDAEWHTSIFNFLREAEEKDLALKFIRDQLRARSIQTQRIVGYLNPSLIKGYPIDIRLRRARSVTRLNALHIKNTLQTGEWDDAILIAYDLLPNNLCLYVREMNFADFITPQHIEALTDAAGERNVRDIMRGQWVWQNMNAFMAIFEGDIRENFGAEGMLKW